MVKKALVLVLLAGCSGPEAPPEGAPISPVDLELRQIRETLSGARTARIRFQGEWPWAVARMPKSVSGTVLLGEGGRAKISLALSFGPGKPETYEAVYDGTRLWRSPGVEAAGFNPEPAGFRTELLMALAWHGIGWSFPQGPHPKTLGQGFVVCDLIPQERDRSPSRMDRAEGSPRIINHECPGVDYRVRVSVDPATRHLRKRELIGDRAAVWYIETYPEVVLNAAIPDAEFRIPEK